RVPPGRGAGSPRPGPPPSPRLAHAASARSPAGAPPVPRARSPGAIRCGCSAARRPGWCRRCRTRLARLRSVHAGQWCQPRIQRGRSCGSCDLLRPLKSGLCLVQSFGKPRVPCGDSALQPADGAELPLDADNPALLGVGRLDLGLPRRTAALVLAEAVLRLVGDVGRLALVPAVLLATFLRHPQSPDRSPDGVFPAAWAHLSPLARRNKWPGRNQHPICRTIEWRFWW